MGLDKHGVNFFHRKISELIETILNDYEEDVNGFQILLEQSDRVFLIGNGGSHSICEHMATDLNKRCGINALTLSSAGYITCLGNDYGFKNIYKSWLAQNHANINDCVIAISSSGKSKDIVRALKHCRDSSISTVGMSGFEGFDSLTVDYNIYFDSYNYGEVEMATEVLFHGIIENGLVK